MPFIYLHMSMNTKALLVAGVVGITTLWVTFAFSPSDVKDAISNDDYSSFITAVGSSPLADVIDSQEKFALLGEIIEAIESGDKKTVRDFISSLRIWWDMWQHGRRWWKGMMKNLTDEQKEILKQARELRESWDEEWAQELLDEAEIALPMWEKRSSRHHGEMEEYREEIHVALEANDYTLLPVDAQTFISEEQFAQM